MDMMTDKKPEGRIEINLKLRKSGITERATQRYGSNH